MRTRSRTRGETLADRVHQLAARPSDWDDADRTSKCDGGFMCGTRATFDYNVALSYPAKDLSTFRHVRAREQSLAVVPTQVAMGKDMKDAAMAISVRTRVEEIPTDDLPDALDTAGEENQAVEFSQPATKRAARCLTLGVPE